MRFTVRQAGDAPGVVLHDVAVPNPGYTDVALFADGLRLAGYFADPTICRFRDKAAGYESWLFRDVTDQERAPIIMALTWES